MASSVLNHAKSKELDSIEANRKGWGYLEQLLSSQQPGASLDAAKLQEHPSIEGLESKQHQPLATECMDGKQYQRIAPKQKPLYSSNLCLRILSGFCIGIGVVALIVAFASLNVATLGGAALAISGAVVLLTGCFGIFATCKKVPPAERIQSSLDAERPSTVH